MRASILSACRSWVEPITAYSPRIAEAAAAFFGVDNPRPATEAACSLAVILFGGFCAVVIDTSSLCRSYAESGHKIYMGLTSLLVQCMG
jgi:hypothetical protein